MARTTFNWEIKYIDVGLTNDSLSPLLSSRVEISFTYKNVFQNVSRYKVSKIMDALYPTK